MLKPLILFTSISVGAWLGWYSTLANGLMAAYLTAVCGASIGLYIGRKLQRSIGKN